MAASHDVEGRLPLTGSSRELDTLTETFNALMASVAAAEAQTEAAYTGAIRALAAALDARDPYTAGHSERVSVLSVAIGRELGLERRGRRGRPARRAAARHRQDWRARRRAAEAGRAHRRRVRRHQTASGPRRADPAIGAVSRAAHSDRRAAPRAAGRPRLSPRPARRRHPARRAHRPRGRRLRRDDQRARLPAAPPGGRRAARAVAVRRHGVSRGDRRRAGHRAARRHRRLPASRHSRASAGEDDADDASPARAAAGQLRIGCPRSPSPASASTVSPRSTCSRGKTPSTGRTSSSTSPACCGSATDGCFTCGPGSGSRGRASGTRKSTRRRSSTSAAAPCRPASTPDTSCRRSASAWSTRGRASTRRSLRI